MSSLVRGGGRPLGSCDIAVSPCFMLPTATGALALGISLMTGCAAPPPHEHLGPLMRTDCLSTMDIPSVQECREAAQSISDELLRICVQGQCASIQVKCSERARLQCQEDNRIYGFTMLAYTPTPNYYGTLNYFYPIGETYWCEEPVSHECMVKALIHELAHSCGWQHRGGRNVPGNDPPRESIPECTPR